MYFSLLAKAEQLLVVKALLQLCSFLAFKPGSPSVSE